MISSLEFVSRCPEYSKPTVQRVSNGTVIILSLTESRLTIRRLSLSRHA